LAGLAAQGRTPDEVLVVVRREDEPTREVLARGWDLPLREVVVERPGAVAARNAGLEVARGDIVAFTDDDAVPRADWLTRLAAAYEDSTVGAVGGRDVIYADGVPTATPPRTQVGVLTWYGRFVTLHPRGTGPARDVDFLKGVNMSISRIRSPALRFDERLRGRGAQVHEDAALCLEVRRAGLRVVYDPEIVVDHYEADRGENDARAPRDLRARRDRHHNQTYLVARYYPVHRVVVHLLYAVVVGMADAPGLLLSVRDIVRTRSLRGHLLPLVANVLGRTSGLATGARLRDR
jgi:cellulose synthase/poly-beta-1,6-N-acetylglucosamine synthase-like glycosyltransferase